MYNQSEYKKKLLKSKDLIALIKPGNRIFLSSGTAVPAATVKKILDSDEIRNYDLEFIQLFATVNLNPLLETECNANNFRLFMFRTGESINNLSFKGRIDFIPANLIEIPFMFATGAVPIDIAIITVSPPDDRGYMSLGIAIDVSRIVIRNASIVIVEINPHMPVTYGDTSIHIDQIDYLIESTMPLPERKKKKIDSVLDRIGWNISNIIQDGSSVILHVGRLFDAVAANLKTKKDIGIITNVISDWVIDLVESGAISLGREKDRGGQISTSYCFGTKELYNYVHQNQLFGFYPIAKLADPNYLRKISKLISIMNVEKIDITAGKIEFHSGDDLLSGYESKFNFAVGTAFSENGKVIFALRSTDQEGKSNIVIRYDENSYRIRSTFSIIRYVVTEYGVANLFGKSISQRALAIIEIAHPDHRESLFMQAKDAGLLYPDQMYRADYSGNYPMEIETMKTFKNGIELKVRPIKQSDEDMMRKLFYTFSDESKYLRYFTSIRTMPHDNMQKYLTIDYIKVLSLVVVLQIGNSERIVAEGRYAEYPRKNTHELAFLVDDEYQGLGIGTFMLNYLIKIARERGIRKLSASVLPQNQKMLKVFMKADVPPSIRTEEGVHEVEYLTGDMNI